MTREVMELIIWAGACAVPFSFIALAWHSHKKTSKARQAAIRQEDWLEAMDPTAWNEYLNPTIAEAVNAGERLLS